MRGALDETVADDAAREELDVALSRLADWMRNQAGNPHDAGGRPA
jgi:hemoglobin